MAETPLKKLHKLLQRPSFTSSEARALGVSASLLSYYAKKGAIERLGHGVYQGVGTQRHDVPFEWEDLVATVASIPNGKVCLISALALYELTEEIPRQHWIAVPHEQFAPKRPQTKIVRYRDMKLGGAQLKLGKSSIAIFNMERTIIDAFRLLTPEVAIKALKIYLSGQRGKPDLAKLNRYSLKLKTPIDKYVLALTV
jgi:predicted transcriptional regulator of viral defense system